MALIMNNAGGAPSVQGFVPVYAQCGFHESGSPSTYEEITTNVSDGSLIIANIQYGSNVSVNVQSGGGSVTDVTSDYSFSSPNYDAKVFLVSGTVTKFRMNHSNAYGGYATVILAPAE